MVGAIEAQLVQQVEVQSEYHVGVFCGARFVAERGWRGVSDGKLCVQQKRSREVPGLRLVGGPCSRRAILL